MTYWGYHLIFTLPLILLFGILQRRRYSRAVVLSWLVLCLIVFAFTTPWDNYAVWLGIWGFGEGVSLGYPWADLARAPDSSEGLTWLGHIPFEEYAFFIIEATLACQVALFFLPRRDRAG
ncbi:MAG: lycopene cyclase domain-containing protein [Verrucomicrobiota bacterium]